MTNMFPKFPVFTFPFNFAGFLYLAVCIQVTWIYSTLTPTLPIDNANATNPMSIQNIYTSESIFYKDLFFRSILRGPAQIYLCDNENVGIIFVIAIAICNWRASVFSLLGSTIGTLFAVVIGIDLDRIYSGLHSYNSTLTMMGIGCIFSTLNTNNFIMAIFHSIICVLIELALITIMLPSGISYLTLPFCLSTMFFAVFAYRKQQEALRIKREESNVNQSFPFKRLQSIRGAPVRLDRQTTEVQRSLSIGDEIIRLDSISEHL
eukprot:79608_1